MTWIADFLLVRIQDRLGIPRWRLIRTLIFTSVLLRALHDVQHEIFSGRTIVAVLFGVLVWAYNCNGFRLEQERANQLNKMIRCRCRWVVEIISLFLFSTVIIFAVAGVGGFLVTGAALFWLGMTFVGTHTYPMTGPTIREKLRNLFASRKTAESET